MRIPATVLATLLTAPLAVAQPHPTLVEGIVVRVNDRILTTSDMRERLHERAAESGHPVTPDQYPEMVKEAADEQCLLERAAELKVEVSDEEVENAIKGLREQNHVQDDATFTQMLRTMGLTLDQLKRRLRDTLAINSLLRREVGNLPITEEELRKRYDRDKDEYRIPERVHLEHIVFPVAADQSDEEAKMAEAQRLVAAARGGQDFLTLVNQEVAAGQGSGGDLGVLQDSDLRKEVRDVVTTMKPGEISTPFSSPAGIHVVRLRERIPPSYKPFSEVVDTLRQRESEDRYRAHFSEIVQSLKKRYVVEVHPEYFTAAN
ncbi:MAG: peptidyl-prolyl cis-trans isomerase [Acidobacteriota bacterium]